jgi:hypothetical protein
MKKIINLVLISSVLAFSCSSSDDTPTPQNPASKGTLSAKVDGKAWDASLTVQAVNTNGVFQITGSDASAKQLSITIMDYKGSGTYQLGGDVTSVQTNTGRWTAGLNPDQTYITQVGLGQGTVKIKESGKEAEGTFDFTAKNTKEDKVSITQGKFKVKL